MVKITVYQSQQHYTGFQCRGHAGFAQYGKDIVCASVSILVINTINGIEQFTKDVFTLDVAEEDDNYIYFHLTGDMTSEAEVLMKTLVLGLTQIQKMYGESYLTLKFEEV